MALERADVDHHVDFFGALPHRLARLVALVCVSPAPSGKPITAMGTVWQPARSRTAAGMLEEFTHTVAKLYWHASSQSFLSSAWVASALRRVWSM